MKKRLLLLILCLTFSLSLIGCYQTQKVKNEITNKVTNEITNKVVHYEDFNILDFQNAVEEAAKKVEKAVVGVILKGVSQVDDETSEDGLGVGSGVIYKAEEILENDKIVNYKYFVVTNRHVVVDEENKIKEEKKVYVYLGDEDLEIEATLVAYDPKLDVACITFEHYTKIQPVEFGDSSALTKGSFVIAVGNPNGFDYYGSVTFGIVSSPLRYISSDTDNDGMDDFYAKYIQHDASINPGNSGGGLFTIDGKLVGINTMKLASSTIDNMGFAITSNEIKMMLEDYLEKNIPYQRPRLGITGIQVRALTPAVIKEQNLKSLPDIYGAERQYGIYVSAVSEGGSCDGSGISPDDIILEFKGTKIKTMQDLSMMLAVSSVSETVEIKYYKRSTNTIETTQIVLKTE